MMPPQGLQPPPSRRQEAPPRYTTLQHLGTGGNGAVWLVDLRPLSGKGTTQRVALKRMKCHTLDMANVALEEVKSLIRMEHPNIVRYQTVVCCASGLTGQRLKRG